MTRPTLLLTALVALTILALAPVVPQTQSASVEISPSRTLLGENVEGNAHRLASRDNTAHEAHPGELRLTVPRLGIKDVSVPDGSTQKELDREGLIRMEEAGEPGTPGSNTFLVGHALGFEQTKRPYIFYKLGKLRPGDRVILRQGDRKYVYRVYDRLRVRPQDYWVTRPVEDKEMVSLQSCTLPDFEKRIVIRAERIQ